MHAQLFLQFDFKLQAVMGREKFCRLFFKPRIILATVPQVGVVPLDEIVDRAAVAFISEPKSVIKSKSGVVYTVVGGTSFNTFSQNVQDIIISALKSFESEVEALAVVTNKVDRALKFDSRKKLSDQQYKFLMDVVQNSEEYEFEEDDDTVKYVLETTLQVSPQILVV